MGQLFQEYQIPKFRTVCSLAINVTMLCGVGSQNTTIGTPGQVGRGRESNGGVACVEEEEEEEEEDGPSSD